MVVPYLFMLTAEAARRFPNVSIDRKMMALRLSYILIPVGIFAWIAFSLPSVMVNYNYILVVVSDPLGLGWDLFGTADIPFEPFFPEWIPAIQGIILLAGLYFGLSRGCAGLKFVIEDPAARSKAMIPPALFALAVVNIFFKLYLG